MNFSMSWNFTSLECSCGELRNDKNTTRKTRGKQQQTKGKTVRKEGFLSYYFEGIQRGRVL